MELATPSTIGPEFRQETTPSASAPPSPAARAEIPSCDACCGSLRPVTDGPRGTLRCESCGHERLAVFPAPEQNFNAYQEEYYQADSGRRFLGPVERSLRLFLNLRVRSILAHAPGPGRLLDVGCGRGDLLEAFQARGWSCVGTQISETAAEAARRSRGVDVACGELPQLGLEEASYDVITFFHVLEHLYDPLAYLLEARRLLKPGGLMLVEVPDCGGWGFRWLRERHLCFDFPHHLRFFGRSSLRCLAERAELDVCGEARFSLEYSPFTTLQCLLNVLPGPPNRLYQALMGNSRGDGLRSSPWTWAHAVVGAVLGGPALLLSAALSLIGQGNTIRLYLRKPADRLARMGFTESGVRAR